MSEGLNLRTKAIKLLEENIGTAIFGIKARISKRNLIKLKRFYTAKETFDKKWKDSLLNGGKDLWMMRPIRG